MKFASAALVDALPFTILAQEVSDLHLNALPRSSEEAARIAAIVNPTKDFTAPERFEERSAGAATVRVHPTSDAFSQPSGNIRFERALDFQVGDGLFRKIWVSAPTSTLASDGLGRFIMHGGAKIFISKTAAAIRLRAQRTMRFQ